MSSAMHSGVLLRCPAVCLRKPLLPSCCRPRSPDTTSCVLSSHVPGRLTAPTKDALCRFMLQIGAELPGIEPPSPACGNRGTDVSTSEQSTSFQKPSDRCIELKAAGNVNRRGHKRHAALLVLAVGLLCAGQLSSAGVSWASGQVPHHMTQDETMFWVAVGVGSTFGVITMIFICRFLMSCFPRLQRQKDEFPWALFTVLDPVLEPMRVKFFEMEKNDLDLASIAMLGVVTTVTEILYGEWGFLLPSTPLSAIDCLQYMIFFQHGLLMSSWVLIVMRWTSFI